MKSIIGTLLLCGIVSVMSYKVGVQDEHVRGVQTANESMHFGMSIGYICGDFHDYDCLSNFKAPQ